jgi:hypothetical protein
MIRTIAAVLLYAVAGTLPAAALDAPTGTPVLTVTGAIANTNSPDGAVFDMEMLNALAQHTTVTETPWTEGEVSFAGPLGRAILEAVGASGTELEVTALNDYAAKVPVADLVENDVILATTMDGKPMSVRDKGPLFLIYPFDQNPDLFNEIYFNRSVWQIKSITVK